MAGAPPNTQPYGQQQQPMPQYAPAAGRRPGSTAPKVWGILLLVLGGVGLLMLVVSIAAAFGKGLDPSAFAFGMSDEGKQEIDRLVRTMAEESRSQWTTWANLAAEAAIALLSLAAGFFLAIRPKAIGRKLAISRALVVMLALPIYGFVSFAELDRTRDLTYQMQKIQVDEALKQEQAKNPKITPEELERRRAEIQDALEAMQPFVGAAGAVGVIITSLCVLAINGLLLFFMTRPAVRDYMNNVETAGAEPIPNYDPSMGLAMGPPPGGQHQAPPPPPTPPV
jgi:multisubunit Na+/H+ antiporter MnhB subunit